MKIEKAIRKWIPVDESGYQVETLKAHEIEGLKADLAEKKVRHCNECTETIEKEDNRVKFEGNWFHLTCWNKVPE